MVQELKGPLPTVRFRKTASANILPPLIGYYSGELTNTTGWSPMGAARTSGRVTDVWMSVGASGKVDATQLRVSGEVRIDGSAIVSVQPSIGHVSGEASQPKTTRVTGDTNITQVTLSGETLLKFSPGAIFEYRFVLDRTGSSTTEISNPTIVVELEPEI